MLTLSVNFKVQTHVLKTFPIKRWLFLFQYHSSNVSKLLERLDRKNDKRIDFIPHKKFISYRTKEQLVFSSKLPRKGINNQWWPCQWVTLFIECSSYQGNNINHKIRTPQGNSLQHLIESSIFTYHSTMMMILLQRLSVSITMSVSNTK